VTAALLVACVLGAAVGPAVPAGVADGDLVELDGVVYQRHGDRLYTLDDPALDLPSDDADASPAITVTGSRLDRDQRRPVLRAETIDGDALRETGARTLADVLEEQGGLQVNSARGLGAEVFVDGLDGRHVLVLIDGRPVTGKVDSRVDVSRLPVSASTIERIEVVRGPMSALYGSDALGGVINIITKKPDGDRRVELEVGGQLIPGVGDARGTLFGARPWSTFGVHGTGGLGPAALRVDVTGADLGGYDRGGRTTGPGVPDGKSDVPDRRNLGVNVDATTLLGDTWSVRTTLLGSFAQTSAFVAAAAPFRDAADNAEVAVSNAFAGPLDVGLAHAVDVTADLRVDRYTHRFAALPSGGLAAPPAFCDTPFAPACPAAPNTKTVAARNEARFELRGAVVLVDDPTTTAPGTEQVALSVGTILLNELAERTNGDGEDTLPGGGQRTTASAYGELLWHPLPWLTILPGARVDAFVVDGDAGVDAATAAIGPKLAARADGPAGLAVRASLGQGFRLPGFEERFLRFDHSELGYVVEGNPDLRPERSVGARLEGTWSAASPFGSAWPLEVGVEASTNLLQDLITESAAGTTDAGIPLFTYANATRALTAAITTRVKLGGVDVPFVPFVPLRVSFDGTWQYLVAALDASGCPDEDPLTAWTCSADQGARSLPLRPAHAVDLTARVLLVPTNTTVFFRTDLLGERPVVDETAPASAVLALGVRQPVAFPGGDGAEIVVGLENLLDQTDPVYGPKPGRHVTLNFRVW
jgi:outer membrane receptor for ferrienterochelin and colicins